MIFVSCNTEGDIKMVRKTEMVREMEIERGETEIAEGMEIKI
jgi:hypothetical protein